VLPEVRCPRCRHLLFKGTPGPRLEIRCSTCRLLVKLP